VDPQRYQRAVDAQLGRAAGGEVEVGGALLHHRLQQLLEVDGGRGCVRRWRVHDQSAAVMRATSSKVVVP
jgi:hypothetical protein